LRRTTPTPSLGPYVVTEYVPNERVVAEANPEFLGEPPAIRRVVVHKISREDLPRAFLTGEVDITVPNAVTLAQAREVQATRRDAVHIRPSAAFVFLAPDLDHPLLGRLEIRRALLMAIDRARLAETVYGDAGRIAELPVPELWPPGAVHTAYDPDASREALAEAGVIGATLKVVHQDDAMGMQILAEVRRDLEAVGIATESVVVPSTFRVAREGRWDGLLSHVLRANRDAPPGRFWNLPFENGEYVYSHRSDAFTDEVFALVERERHALYPERREQLRDALLALTTERLPNLPLVFAAERILADPSLQGWDHGSTTVFGSWLHTWHFAP
ncbi:MAG: ABC transporter substrate-binding protein, partial [Myxococcota bacterium]